nr:hypothetical protein [uncultured Flavobacterium sp.]
MSNNIFVFVVCGAKEHIDTLHFSLEYLKKYSEKTIYIVTDKVRNEIEIKHNTIININTPEDLNHHQASIYLKTGLHKFLPKGNNYCYLDTDVIAINTDCDAIFEEFASPISFAPDHCKIKKFSAYAVNCDCSDQWKTDRETFALAQNKFDKNVLILDSELLEQSRKLDYIFNEFKKSSLKKITTAIRYFFSYPIFILNTEFYYNKKTKAWFNKKNEVVKYNFPVKKIEKETGFKYKWWNHKWINSSGINLWEDQCEHLIDEIRNTFGIIIKDKNWQHWNGGVFLFNDSSADFLESWHQKTVHIFSLPNWKTRDQGTLIATVWEFGLQSQPTLSKKWNFLADYHNSGLALKATDNLISDNGFKNSYAPNFIHVYHNWGKKDWSVWQWIETK